jgi:uncharacterized surface protein with fasciclin (FAS1) repeats
MLHILIKDRAMNVSKYLGTGLKFIVVMSLALTCASCANKQKPVVTDQQTMPSDQKPLTEEPKVTPSETTPAPAPSQVQPGTGGSDEFAPMPEKKTKDKHKKKSHKKKSREGKSKKAGKSEEIKGGENIISTLNSIGHYDIFVRLAKQAGMMRTLRDKGNYTVLAPSDKAFSKLPKGMLDNLMKPANRDKLRKLVGAHVITGSYSTSKLKKMKAVQTFSGINLYVTSKKDSISIGGVRVSRANIICGNGVIHSVGSVIVPKSIRNESEKSSAKPNQNADVHSEKKKKKK